MKGETGIRPMKGYAAKRAEREAGTRPEFEFRDQKSEPPLSRHEAVGSVKYHPSVGPRRLNLMPDSEERATVTCIITSANLPNDRIIAKTEAGDTIRLRLRIFDKTMVIRLEHVVTCRVRCTRKRGLEATRIITIKPPELFTK